MNLILFGFKGCGKTTCGKKLAERMRRPFLELTEEPVGAWENHIIAVSGEVMLNETYVEALSQAGQLVYLEASFDTLRRRLLRKHLAQDDSWQTLYHAQRPLFESIRARKVNVDLLDEAGVIAALCNILLLEEPALPA